MSDKLGASGQDKGKDQGSTPGKKKDKKTKGGKGGNSAGDGKGQGQQKTADGNKSPRGKTEDKPSDTDPNKPQKSKAELKAERRALQEQQRALKDQKKETGTSSKDTSSASVAKIEPKRVPDHLMADDVQAQKKMAKKLEKQKIPQRTKVQRQVRLFEHLHQYEREVSLTQSLSFRSCTIHPAIVRLGVQYAEGVICGSNARCLAMLVAFKQVIADYTTPAHKELSRDLEARIKPYISFLNQCRLMSVSMGNAIKYLKYNISCGTRDLSEIEAKQNLIDSIDDYIKIKIILPAKAISTFVIEDKKIVDNDVIVVYACSSLVLRVLRTAHENGIKFRVIVIDGRPRMEGKEMLRRLVRAGIKCSYMLINAVSYAMQEATKVFLGAHALLANGCVMSRVGSSQLALVAKSFNVSVLVCCETYKFCERGQTDSFVLNELGDPDDLVNIGNKTAYLSDWRDYNSLTLLNLVYDVTPPEFVSVVITELGLIPCTSVPVVLRMKQVETAET
ncbi:translation initiation factor eIF-2B subunit delta [Mytilus galloprovincialis]|uniref:Translation initiation factor eIF2B subunit delta n=2 Tax=Mytilus galloprovincialis TaxID=29158 RepID=A0A8B6C6H4_MYTGA|nr:translation initiation factor eIF-2B subunit delta [Mytilus galloprovincialis]